MSGLQTEIRGLTSAYMRQGGKTNRRQQLRRMLAFGDFCEQEGVRSLAQVGARHVVRYWKSEPVLQLSDRTREGHYYAVAALWRIAGKPGKPPKPFPMRPETT